MKKIIIIDPHIDHLPSLLLLLKQQYEILNSYYPDFYHQWTQELEAKAIIFLKEILEKQSGAFVAKVDNVVVGLITFSTAQRGHFDTIFQEFIDVTELIVDSNYRSLGIGQKLIDTVKEKSRAEGIKLMRVVVSAKNERGIVFYEHSGFEFREFIGFMEL